MFANLRGLEGEALEKVRRAGGGGGLVTRACAADGSEDEGWINSMIVKNRCDVENKRENQLSEAV